MYVTGTITSATPAVDLMAILQTQLVAAGLTLVDANYKTTAGTTNPTADVYKSAAGSNVAGVDFWVIVRRSADAAASVSVVICEAYDVGTHRATLYGSIGTSVTPTAVTFTHPGGALAPDAVALYATNTPFINTPTTTFNYFLSATPDRVVVSMRPGAGSGNGFYAGLYEDMLPSGMVAVPLCTVSLNQQSSQIQGTVTREPNQAAAATGNFLAQLAANSSNIGVQAALTPLTTAAALYANVYSVGRTLLHSGRVAYAAITADSIRGMLRDMVSSTVSGGNGDTITYNGHTYVKVGAHSPSANTEIASMFVDTSI